MAPPIDDADEIPDAIIEQVMAFVERQINDTKYSQSASRDAWHYLASRCGDWYNRIQSDLEQQQELAEANEDDDG